jgi:hypothetical protein
MLKFFIKKTEPKRKRENSFHEMQPKGSLVRGRCTVTPHKICKLGTLPTSSPAGDVRLTDIHESGSASGSGCGRASASGKGRGSASTSRRAKVKVSVMKIFKKQSKQKQQAAVETKEDSFEMQAQNRHKQELAQEQHEQNLEQQPQQARGIKPHYHERQPPGSLICGKCAVNNVIGGAIYSDQSFVNASKENLKMYGGDEQQRLENWVTDDLLVAINSSKEDYSAVDLAQGSTRCPKKRKLMAAEMVSLLKGTYSKQFLGVVQHTPGHWFALKHGSYNNASAFVRVCSLVDSNLDYVGWNDIEDHISANFRQERRGTQKDNSIVIFSGKTTNTGFQKGVKKARRKVEI